MELAMSALAFLGFGASELLLVLVAIILLFGVDKLPDLARALGRAQAKFSRARDEVVETLEIERAGLTREQVAFERARDAQVAAANAVTEAGDEVPAPPGNAPSGDKRPDSPG